MEPVEGELLRKSHVRGYRGSALVKGGLAEAVGHRVLFRH